MNIEISFMYDRVFQIHAYFPSEHFDAVWLALRQRYGNEIKRETGKIEWLAHELSVEKPLPDEIVLFRKPEEPLLVDGEFIRTGIIYSVIEYTSPWDANEKAKARDDEHKRKIKGIADKL